MQVLGAHATSQDDHALQEVLVSHARTAGLLVTSVHVSPPELAIRGLDPLHMQWGTTWPSDCMGSWDIFLVGHAPFEERWILAENLDAAARDFSWWPPAANKNLKKLTSNLLASRFGFQVEVQQRTKGAVTPEPMPPEAMKILLPIEGGTRPVK